MAERKKRTRGPGPSMPPQDRKPRARAAGRRGDADPQEPLATQKLQKVLAQAGLGSRRGMETWITEGKVTVNGAPANLGMRVSERDQIKIDGRLIRAPSASRLPRVLLYHKPEGEIVSRSDPKGRPSVFEHLPSVVSARWIAIGRLDFNTCGLLIFTTSGEVANRMMHPRFEMEREYAVRVMGKLLPEHMQQLTQGIELDDGMAHCERVELRGGEGANQWCHVILKEGRKRIVRRLFEKLGFVVSRLMRVRFGAVALPPRIKRGHYLELSEDEVRKLMIWLGVEQSAMPSRQRADHAG